MSLKDHQDAQDLLQRYDDLETARADLAQMYEDVESGIGSYQDPDELRADINEALADLADRMAEVLRKVTFS